ncbi:MAG: porin [Azoarcus sp.]|nr:porin [Azoarcus sp.]
MQKKLIALAVAGLMSAPVMAQSNVTIYGIVDVGMVYAKQGDNKFRGVESGTLRASRIGFKGTEDLGNGLKAKFNLEYGIAADTGTALTPRRSYLGLEGGFGFVGLGRQYSPGYDASVRDAGNFLLSGTFTPQAVLAGGAGATIRLAGAARWNNSINYRSKSYGGLEFQAIYALGEKNQDNDRSEDDKLGLGALYKNGPIEANVIYHRIDGGGSSDQKEWMLSGAYDFGVAKVSASWQTVDVGSMENDVWSVSGAIPVSQAGKVSLGYGQLNHEDSDLDADMWSIVYFHDLSKRTTAYAGYTRINNDKGSLRNFAVNADPGNNTDGFAVGVRHFF